VNLPPDLPLVLVEATLIVQILSNLLENAAKYTPPGTTITISAAARSEHFLLVRGRRWSGLPPGDPERCSRSFSAAIRRATSSASDSASPYAARPPACTAATCAPCNNPGGGARFEITLPVETQANAPAVAEPC
jgi:two-component system sensor histidine kinase KdpD